MFRPVAFASLMVLIGCSSHFSTTQPAPAITTNGPQLSPQNTHIVFTGTALMTSHQGTFTRFAGLLDDPDSDPAHARITAGIEMDSVYTEIPLLTKHLKADDFFDVQEYPTANFASTKVERVSTSADSYTITGDLTLHGIKKSISFPADFYVDGRKITLSARITIRQSDFKMQSASTTTDDVPVAVSAQILQR